MSAEEQAEAYLNEAELTLESAQAIYSTASETGNKLWAQVVKNEYDAIEQAVSAAIAAEGEDIPRRHPAKVNTFLEIHNPSQELADSLLNWLRRRSEAQYVDIRGDQVNIPHDLFDKDDAEQILEDAESVIELVESIVDKG
jgi:HEPN domain-containing protein